MVGLQYLFLEPNADDPLNKGAFSFLFLCDLASTDCVCNFPYTRCTV